MSEHHPILAAFLKAGGPLTMTDPLASSLRGVIVEMDPDAGTGAIRFEPGPQFLQGGGVIHGGIITTMLDYAFAMAGFSRLQPGKSFGTVSLTVHFLKPVLPGPHIARARLDRMGSRMLFTSGELCKEGSDSPLATGTSVLAITTR